MLALLWNNLFTMFYFIDFTSSLIRIKHHHIEFANRKL